MDKPPITLVVARAQNGVIGRDGKLPWHIPADLKRFKALTMGSAMVMGRRTFESLAGLAARTPAHRPDARSRLVRDRAPRSRTASTEALELAADERVSVIGGADIFALFLPLADRIELTEVLEDIAGDTSHARPATFRSWREVWSEGHAAEDGRPPFRFRTLERGSAGRREIRPQAVHLSAEHLIDRRGNLVGAAVEEAGHAIVERHLGSTGDRHRPSRP